MKPQRSFSLNKLTILFTLIFIILGFLIYSNILYAPFIFDDEWFIVTNEQIRDISSFFKDFSGTRYIGFLSFAVNYYFEGLNTFGYHVVNIAIHILNAMLVYFLISLTFETGIGKGIGEGKEKNIFLSIPLPALIAFYVSLIFLVHPIQTQAVAYIMQRFTSLATLFYLLALVLYVKARLVGQGFSLALSKPKGLPYMKGLTFYCLSLFSTILAMKTKELSFTLPFIIILYEFTFFNPPFIPPLLKGGRGDFLKRFLYLIPYLLMLIIIPLEMLSSDISSVASGGGVQQKLRSEITIMLDNPARLDYIFTQFNVMVTYIRLLFFPVNQHFVYDYPISHSIFEVKTLLSFMFLISIFGSAIYLYLKARKADNAYGLLISFGILWFFITLSIVSIIPLSGVIFEHWLYLPSFGFILSVTAIIFYSFEYLQKRTGKQTLKYLLAVITAIALIFTISTYKRNILWKAPLDMWLDIVKKSPNRADAHFGLGTAYDSQGKIDEAKKEYLTVIRLNPHYADAHYNLGNVYHDQGKLDEAIQEYKAALRLNPDNTDAHYNLGNIYHDQGKLDEAMQEYKAVLRLNPDNAYAHYYLRLALQDKKTKR